MTAFAIEQMVPNSDLDWFDMMCFVSALILGVYCANMATCFDKWASARIALAANEGNDVQNWLLIVVDGISFIARGAEGLPAVEGEFQPSIAK